MKFTYQTIQKYFDYTLKYMIPIKSAGDFNQSWRLIKCN
jgi:hypothetical protein